jgi:hypothetical protein
MVPLECDTAHTNFGLRRPGPVHKVEAGRLRASGWGFRPFCGISRIPCRKVSAAKLINVLLREITCDNQRTPVRFVQRGVKPFCFISCDPAQTLFCTDNFAGIRVMSAKEKVRQET